MRGGAQSHLIEADDGRFYIVKFQNNPQHRRILVNEWIAGLAPARCMPLFNFAHAADDGFPEIAQHDERSLRHRGKERRAQIENELRSLGAETFVEARASRKSRRSIRT